MTTLIIRDEGWVPKIHVAPQDETHCFFTVALAPYIVGLQTFRRMPQRSEICCLRRSLCIMRHPVLAVFIADKAQPVMKETILSQKLSLIMFDIRLQEIADELRCSTFLFY